MPKGQFKNPKERARKISEGQKTGKFFSCLICGSKFWRKKCQIAKGQNKFCSKKCYFIWQKGKGRSEEFKKKCQIGQNKRHEGKILISDKNKLIRCSKDFKVWRSAVFQRDNWTCQECGNRSKKNNYIRIEAHHIKPFALFPEFRFSVDNGITLCKKCHVKKPKGKEIYCIK